MPVYIDFARNNFRGMIMCHMLADTIEELHAMADKLGLKRQWFQSGNIPHYDLSLSKRREAIKHGVQILDGKQIIQLIKKWRESDESSRL